MKPARLFPRRRLTILQQAEAAECGLACLAMILNWHGSRTDLQSLRRRWPVSLRGLTAAQLLSIAGEAGLSARALRLELADLRRLRAPCILHWKLDHFVVLEKATANAITVVDPATGRQTHSLARASDYFTGIALELTPASGFPLLPASEPFRWSHLVAAGRGLGGAMLQLLLLSLALQCFTLLTPFYTQIVIDDIVVSADVDLLRLVALSFGGLAVFIAASSALRSWVIVYLGATLDFRWSSGLFARLLHLPFDYFERRHTGDIQSRFRSLDAVRELLTTQGVEALIDGLMALTTICVLLCYSPLLTLPVLLSLLLYLAVRLILFRPMHAAAQELVARRAEVDSTFLETVRGIVAIRNFAGEPLRRLVYENRNADAISATVDAGRLAIWQQAASQAIFGLQNVAVIWIAARSIIDGGFTVGMLVAFLAYKTHCTSRSSALIDKLFQFRLLRVHLDRLRDIVATEPDCSLEPARAGAPVGGDLEARNLAFRYGPQEPWVFRGISFTVEQGEHVAIAGRSGCGKSTLLKMLAGLALPTEGEIIVGGRVLNARSIAGWRRSVGVVMQDDQLLSGTLLDNIAFFDSRPDTGRAKECLRMAGILDEVEGMPMGLQTLVGDMGSTFSGGQKQRLLLARALYREPAVLLLDEATSHLDATTEAALVRRICQLDITRIVIAHRAETLRHADRVITPGT